MMARMKNGTTPHAADYVTREEAVQILGIKVQSFYTYVSRGMVRRRVIPGDKRKLYFKSDIERLAAKSVVRRNTGLKGAGSMRYGDPIVQTWISEITVDGPRYRNRAATELAAANVTFESVAELLWVGHLHFPDARWTLEPLPAVFDHWSAEARQLCSGGRVDPIRISCFLLAALSASGCAEDPTSSGNTLSLARQLLQILAGAAGYLGPERNFEPFVSGELLAQCIARGFGRGKDAQVIQEINAALVTCAEHELAPPTFAARVCASTGADLISCVTTGILAHMGPLQGGGSDGVEDLLTKALAPRAASKFPGQRQSSFEIPGFNHQLYLKDPRAMFLLDRVRKLETPHRDTQRMLQLIDRVSEEDNVYPSITGALVVLCRALGLPKRSGNLLFSTGRTAGWIAHVLEQRMAGFMLRPRARFMAQPESRLAGRVE